MTGGAFLKARGPQEINLQESPRLPIFEPDEDSGLVGLVAFEFKMRCMGSGIEEGWELLDLRTPAAAFWNINSFIHDRSPVFDERGNFVWRSV